MSRGGDLADLRVLLALLDESPFHMKHLALACGVDPAQVSRWKGHVEKKTDPRLNDQTRDAIAVLMGRVPDYLTPGAQDALRAMRATVEELEAAGELRRQFRDALTTRPATGKAALGERGQQELGTGREAKKRAGRGRREA